MLTRVGVNEERLRDPDAWYLAVPAIARLRAGGVALDRRVTIVVGENGSGKSTFVEAVAQAWRQRIKAAVEHWGPPPSAEDADLWTALSTEVVQPISHGGCFLRAEAMHAMFAQLDREEAQLRAFGGPLNSRSHGEGFLDYLESRLTERGLFVLDEPEAALSFTSCLRLLSVLGGLADAGSQIILSTHSPVLAAFPGATILEFGADGIRPAKWDELDVVQHWQAFLARPQSYLRHLFG